MQVSELFDIKGKIAIVTGGSKGLGAQCADALAEMGCNVVIAARKIERCQELCAELEQKYGVQTLAVSCDVGNTEDGQKLVDATINKFGQIDILINNAGTAWGSDPMNHDRAGWQKVIDLNLTGTFYLTGAVAKTMKEKGNGGKILFMSSTAGLVASKRQSTPSYTATKAALIMLARDLGYKWARYGIYVNCLVPGYFPTDFAGRALDEEQEKAAKAIIPAKRFGSEYDLKGAVAFFCSKASDYVIGQYMVIDGGATL